LKQAFLWFLTDTIAICSTVVPNSWMWRFTIIA